MRQAFIVYVDLDPMPGAFSDKDSAKLHLQHILSQRIGHYRPEVADVPDDMQPKFGYENSPQHIPGSLDRSRLFFGSRALAHAVLLRLRQIIKRDGNVTVAELYVLTGNKPHYSDHYWGWTDASPFYIQDHPNKHADLIMPSPINLKNIEGL